MQVLKHHQCRAGKARLKESGRPLAMLQVQTCRASSLLSSHGPDVLKNQRCTSCLDSGVVEYGVGQALQNLS